MHVFIRFRAFLTLPTFPSEEDNRIAQQLLAILLLGLVVAPLSSVLLLLFTDDYVGPIINALMTVILFILLVKLKEGKLRLVSSSLILSGYLAVMVLIIAEDGVRDEAVQIIPVLLILTAIFLDGQASVRLAVLTLLLMLILFMAEWVGWLETPNFLNRPSPGSLLIVVLSISLTAIMLRLTVAEIVKKARLLEEQAKLLEQQNAQLEQTGHALEAKNATLETYHEQLEELVAERTKALSQTITTLKEAQSELLVAKEAAEVANHAKSKFISTMSHELRTPLNGILGYAQLLKRDQSLAATQMKGVQTIYQSGHHLLSLINDILDHSKIEAGKIELYAAPFHLGSFLDGIASLMRLRAEKKALLFRYEAEQALPAGVSADKKRLQQVLLNLLGNALKFTHQGEVSLKVKLLHHNGTSCKLGFEICDTGVGMSAEQLEKIFLPFEQLGDRNQRAEGAGLGLAITRKLVNLMGGEVQVESQPGKGSTFSFDLSLPVAQASAEEGLEARSLTSKEEMSHKSEPQASPPALLPPPANSLQALYQSAKLGMMSHIRQQANDIEQLDAKYAPFANKMRELARGFEDEKIVALLEEYMESAMSSPT